MSKKPVVLIILDGFGIAPDENGNAVIGADTPYIDSLFAQWPHTEILCYGEAVGLPEGQMGNSEVGHLNLGSGRVIYQDITRISKAIRDGELPKNQAIMGAIEKLRANGKALHLIGLLSDGGVHSLQTHLEALVDLAVKNGVKKIHVHAILDGRDTPPDSGVGYLRQLEDFLNAYPNTDIASVCGRFWAMDRDKRWERVERGWNAIVRAKGDRQADPVTAVEEAYSRDQFDEFIEPMVVVDINDQPVGKMADGDAVIFFNFRADRAREFTWAFNQPGFEGFDVSDKPALSSYVCMTQYDEHLEVPVAFPPQTIEMTLADVVSQAGGNQLHIAETEKYAHVTFFFNGGREEPVNGEDRVLIPSPSEVDTYDQKPQMSAPEVTEEVLKRIRSGNYDLIVMNYANGDMVGHTGVYDAARQAVETLDKSLSQVIPAVLEAGGKVVLTADHGNAEQMIDPASGGPYTAHTVSNPVPLVLIDPDNPEAPLKPGALCDVSPTLLALMGLKQPEQMTGCCLYE